MNNYIRHVLASKEEQLTADYKTRNPSYKTHKGMDFIDGTGKCVIVAVADGVVDSCRNDVIGVDHNYNTAGNYVRIRHPNGAYTRYLHLQTGSVCVKAGQAVKTGDKLGIMGETGDSYGMHLHFDVCVNGEYVDPLPYLTGAKGFGVSDPAPVPAPSEPAELRKGGKVTLKSAPLYVSSTAGKKSGTVTGDYYIYADGIINGRVRITTPKGCADCTGWVNIADCKTDSPAPSEPAPEKSDVLYRVQVGAYSVKANADAQLAKVQAAGFDAFVTKVDNLYKVQVGAYNVKQNAENQLAKVKAAGFDAFIATVNQSGGSTPAAPSLKVGDKVKMAKDAPVYGKSTKFQSWVYNSTLYVREISGDRIVVSTLKTGDVTGAVDRKYLTKI